MNQYDYTPDRPPTPQQIAAWADGESSRGEADFVEAWMADHPAARREADALARLTRLYRDQPLPLPSEDRWRATFDRIRPPAAPRTARPWKLLLGLALASAAALGAVVLARALWPAAPPAIGLQTPPAPEEDDEEPFAVAASSEVHIIRMDADDADAVVTGRPLIGTMDFTGPGDIDVLQVQSDPDGKHTPRLETRAGLSWLVARADEEGEP